MANSFSFLDPIQTDRLSLERYSFGVVVHYAALIAFSGHLLFTCLFYWLRVETLVLVNLGSCFIYILCFWINRRGYSHLALMMGEFEVVAHAILAVAFVGWGSGFHYYILDLTPLIFYSQKWEPRTKLGLTALNCILYTGLYLYSQQALPLYFLESRQTQMLGVINITTLYVVFAFVAILYRSGAVQAEAALKQANAQLEFLAQTDPLTRLHNRRKMTQEIARFSEIAHLSSVPCSMILADLDNFKTINDRFGHEVGDQVLIEVAQVMQSCLRKQDLICRWGGEEFLILLPGAVHSEAELITHRLCKKVASTRISVGKTESFVTVTCGMSTLAGDCSAAEWIHRTDMAMYEGKRRGKNCVVTA